MEILVNIVKRFVNWSVLIFPSSRYLREGDIQTCDSVRKIVSGIVQNNQDLINTTRVELFHHFETHDLELLEELSLGHLASCVYSWISMEHLIQFYIRR